MKKIIFLLFTVSSIAVHAQQPIFNYSEKATLWGYIKSDGTKITPADYKQISDFTSDGYGSFINVATKEAVIVNTNGEVVDLGIDGIIDIEYIGETEKNLATKAAIIKVGKKVGICSLEGKMIHPLEFDKIKSTNSSVLVGYKGKTVYLLTATGSSIALDASIVEVRNFSEGLAPFVNSTKKMGFIDQQGKIVVEAAYFSVGYFSAGLAWVKPEEKKVGFIDKTGKIVINADYTMAKDFDATAKRTLVSKGEVDLYLTTTGEEIKVEGATKLGNFENGFAYAFKGEKVGFVNSDGKWVVEPIYTKVHHFHDGLAQVRLGTVWGFVDAQGKEVIAPQFDDLGDFKNGFAPAKKGAVWGIIDKTGKFVVEPQYLKVK